jgi:hypothetical protein
VSRRARITLIATVVVAFALISAILARWLQLENVERDDVLSLLRAQATGNAQSVLAKLHGCDAACRAAVARDVATLRGPGNVQILARNSGTAYTLTTRTAQTRIAWKLPHRLPVVQCVLIRRKGNAVTGLSVTLLSLSAPIPSEADC